MRSAIESFLAVSALALGLCIPMDAPGLAADAMPASAIDKAAQDTLQTGQLAL